MVGSPKTLGDLRRADCAIEVRCHACGRVELLDREVTMHERAGLRATSDWATFCREQKCRTCLSDNVRVLPAPYCQNSKELRRRRWENTLINLALEILDEAARQARKGTVGTPEVRLALRVLHPFLRDENLLREFWRGATEEPRPAWNGCNLPFRWIATKLIERGYGVNAEFR